MEAMPPGWDSSAVPNGAPRGSTRPSVCPSVRPCATLGMHTQGTINS